MKTEAKSSVLPRLSLTLVCYVYAGDHDVVEAGRRSSLNQFPKEKSWLQAVRYYVKSYDLGVLLSLHTLGSMAFVRSSDEETTTWGARQKKNAREYLRPE
jgi:uncharacterized membrane protein YkgB